VTYFDKCPKCAHASLPADQSLPAACPSCGVILAKLAAYQAPAAVTSAAIEPEQSLAQRARARLLYVPERVDQGMFWLRVALLLLFAWWGIRLIAMDVTSGEIASSFLHGPLLVFHEAGHVIFSFFGEFMTILGGSFMQLLMPAIFVAAFLWKNEDPFGAAIGFWFFGVSLLDLAPYIYDALHPQLILLGGHTGEEGGHDWMYLLDRLGLRGSAQTFGWLVHKLGTLAVLASLAWGSVLLNKQRTQLGHEQKSF
jgi:hypothetical protein